MTIPVFAQKGEEEKGGGGKPPQAQHQAQPQHAEKAAPQQHTQKAEPQRAEKAAPQQHAQKTEPQRAEKAQPQRAQAAPQRAQATRQVQPQRAQVSARNGGGQYGRISNANYTSHFGQGHSFHVGHPEFSGGYNRFQYGGYSFGYNEGWPIGWNYDDNCYVVFEDGAYYLYDLNHPGIHISLNIF